MNKEQVDTLNKVIEGSRGLSALKSKKLVISLLGWCLPVGIATQVLEKSAMLALLFIAVGNISLIAYVLAQTFVDCRERAVASLPQINSVANTPK